MMENSILSRLPVDPGVLLIAMFILTIICIILTIVCAVHYKRLYRRYDIFMRGRDAESLEGTILKLLDETNLLRSENRSAAAQVQAYYKQVKASFQRTGIVKYNAFKGMGGDLSFVLAVLDDNNSGWILNSVHSREGCYLYIKDVIEGKTEVLLGNEEREALEKALGYR